MRIPASRRTRITATEGREGGARSLEIGLVMAGALSAGACTVGVADFPIQSLDQRHEGPLPPQRDHLADPLHILCDGHQPAGYPLRGPVPRWAGRPTADVDARRPRPFLAGRLRGRRPRSPPTAAGAVRVGRPSPAT